MKGERRWGGKRLETLLCPFEAAISLKTKDSQETGWGIADILLKISHLTY
jgi:hypothetical protein